MHLTALRALGDDLTVGIKIVGEGSEEQGTGGLEAFVPEHSELLSADAILVCDAGNFAVGMPSLTTSLRGLANVWVTVRTLSSAMHSGMFGGAAPDALAALIAMLATLRDAPGQHHCQGSGRHRRPGKGAAYPPGAVPQRRERPRRRRPARRLRRGHDLGTAAATVLGIDCPPVIGSSASIQPEARARINLRVPPGMDAKLAQDALIDHLTSVAPWHVGSTSSGKPTVSLSSLRWTGPAMRR